MPLYCFIDIVLIASLLYNKLTNMASILKLNILSDKTLNFIYAVLKKFSLYAIIIV